MPNPKPADADLTDSDDITAVGALPPAARLIESFREGRAPSDLLFDRYLPRALRLVSVVHFTPVVVAQRAAEWIAEYGVRTVVDIGSGAGKFCVAAALAGQASYTGLEQRPSLVAAARELARTFGLERRVFFLQGTIGEGQTPIPLADAYYLFNPFGENVYGPDDHIDETVELNDERFVRDVLAVESLLEELPVGTYVFTYNGFGGEIPAGYQELRTDESLPNVLRLWRKTMECSRR